MRGAAQITQAAELTKDHGLRQRTHSEDGLRDPSKGIDIACYRSSIEVFLRNYKKGRV